MLELGPNGLEVGERWLPLKSKPTRADRSSQDSCSPPGFFLSTPFPSFSLHLSFYPTLIHCLSFSSIYFPLSSFVHPLPASVLASLLIISVLTFHQSIPSSTRLMICALCTHSSCQQLLCITHSHPLSVFILEMFCSTRHSFQQTTP